MTPNYQIISYAMQTGELPLRVFPLFGLVTMSELPYDQDKPPLPGSIQRILERLPASL